MALIRRRTLKFKDADQGLFSALCGLLRRLSAWVLLLGLGWAPTAYAFCGLYVSRTDSALSNETSQVIMVREGNRTVLTLQNDFRGPLADFALVIPTPALVERGQVRIVDKTLFDRLDAYSTPRLAEHYDNDPCQMELQWGRAPSDSTLLKMALPPAPSSVFRSELQAERDKAMGVRVENQYTLGEYDIVNLSATQSEGLETWLADNGYRVPKGAGAALRSYLAAGMKFFVVKVNLRELEKSGLTTLRPLQFGFETDKFILPMRLGTLNAPPDKPQDLVVYVLTRQGRVESSNFKTLKVPANENIPFFVKPRFKDFYRATFDFAAQREDYKAVFTEYFWDMAGCEPCTAAPLNPEELRRAGVFWLSEVGPSEATPTGLELLQKSLTRGFPGAGASAGPPVLLTRLHMRYTARTVTDDLVLTQTKDRRHWQTRYVIRHPFASNVAQCGNRLGATDCELMCKARLPAAQKMLNHNVLPVGVGSTESKTEPGLLASCISTCSLAKQASLDRATRYYEVELPPRLAQEKQTLARLTGWSMLDINDIPNAQLYGDTNESAEVPVASATADAVPPAKPPRPPWWKRIYEKAKKLGKSLTP
jgi:hypothetical protein